MRLCSRIIYETTYGCSNLHFLCSTTLLQLSSHHALNAMQVALLDRYNISPSETALKQLEEAPRAWAALQTKVVIRCVHLAVC